MLTIHRHIQSPVKHPVAFSAAIFEKVSILDVLKGSEYISANTFEFLQERSTMFLSFSSDCH